MMAGSITTFSGYFSPEQEASNATVVAEIWVKLNKISCASLVLWGGGDIIIRV
jgi:hypothetical protein